MDFTKEIIKIGKIGVLTNKNINRWFWLVESYLRGKDLWEVIEDVINIRKSETEHPSPPPAGTAGLTPESISDPSTPPLLPSALQEKSVDKDWMKKNFLAITTIGTLISALDKRIVKRYRYASDVWTYLKGFYEEKDQTIMIKGLKCFIT